MSTQLNRAGITRPQPERAWRPYGAVIHNNEINTIGIVMNKIVRKSRYSKNSFITLKFSLYAYVNIRPTGKINQF